MGPTPLTHEMRRKCRSARRIGFKRPRRRRRKPPTRQRRAVRSTRRRPNPHAQQECRDPRSRRRKRQPPAGRKVERLRLSPRLNHNRAQRRRAHRLLPGPQRVFPRRDLDEHHLRRIKPQLCKPPPIDLAGFAVEKVLPDPNERPCPRSPRGNRNAKALGRRHMQSPGSLDLVQPRALKTTRQRSVDLGDP